MSAQGGRILVVCTGNICRSAYLERRLEQVLAGTGIEVTSAGIGAMVGWPIDPGSAHELRRRGARTEDYAARQLTAPLIIEADLVLTASARHRGWVVQEVPRAFKYCLSWGDFVQRVEELDLVASGGPEPGTNWVAHVASLAAARRGRPASPEKLDIPDPYRRGPAQFAQMAARIEAGLPAVVAALARSGDLSA